MSIKTRLPIYLAAAVLAASPAVVLAATSGNAQSAASSSGNARSAQPHPQTASNDSAPSTTPSPHMTKVSETGHGGSQADSHAAQLGRTASRGHGSERMTLSNTGGLSHARSRAHTATRELMNQGGKGLNGVRNAASRLPISGALQGVSHLANPGNSVGPVGTRLASQVGANAPALGGVNAAGVVHAGVSHISGALGGGGAVPHANLGAGLQSSVGNLVGAHTHLGVNIH